MFEMGAAVAAILQVLEAAVAEVKEAVVTRVECKVEKVAMGAPVGTAEARHTVQSRPAHDTLNGTLVIMLEVGDHAYTRVSPAS